MGTNSSATNLQGTWSRLPAPLILMPSIVDPARPTLGAATVTRSLVHLLESEPLCARVHCLPVPSPPSRLHRLRQASSLARSLVSRLPSKAEFTRSGQYRRSLSDRLQERDFDVVLLNGSDLLWLSNELPLSLPQVVVAHNIEHRLFESQVRSASWARPLRHLLDRDCARLKAYELAGFERVHNVIFLCAEDAAQVMRIHPNVNALIQPPVFDYPPSARRIPDQPGARLQIGFVGNLGWWPNNAGLGWFLREVFPHVKDRVQLHLFGEGSEEVTGFPCVTAHGFVADPARIWESCDFMICPVFAGGGISIKVAEAIYNRVPVVASSFAVRGLPLLEDPAIVVLGHAADWVPFLRSPQAHALAGRRVSATLAEPFHARHHLRAVQTYFAGLLREGAISRADCS